jgi:Fur family ferric uptake transcriptional regulator
MKPSASEVFARVVKSGHRLTRTRRAVIEALAAAKGPACVRELHAAAGPVDLVTVYRVLHWLVELGPAREVNTLGNGGERYELVDDTHTHHLFCTRCKQMLTVPVCGIDPDVLDALKRTYDFVTEDHRITFHGICAECRDSEDASPPADA